MSTRFDRIVIAVPDLQQAVSQYRDLMGFDPETGSAAGGQPSAAWPLANTVIALEQGPVAAPRIQGLVLAAGDASPGEVAVDNPLGLDVRLAGGGGRAAEAPATFIVDHLVLRTDNADACIALFADTLGVRLALDKTVPEWGGRMLFFRGGKMTLEVIESDKDGAGGNFFWGIAYQCPQLDTAVSELTGRGVALSALRDGRKPGTRVATVKSHCLEIPTLLIEPAK